VNTFTVPNEAQNIKSRRKDRENIFISQTFRKKNTSMLRAQRSKITIPQWGVPHCGIVTEESKGIYSIDFTSAVILSITSIIGGISSWIVLKTTSVSISK
jgi:hypothetical protein